MIEYQSSSLDCERRIANHPCFQLVNQLHKQKESSPTRDSNFTLVSIYRTCNSYGAIAYRGIFAYIVGSYECDALPLGQLGVVYSSYN
jgi:hypothetical protein